MAHLTRKVEKGKMHWKNAFAHVRDQRLAMGLSVFVFILFATDFAAQHELFETQVIALEKALCLR